VNKKESINNGQKKDFEVIEKKKPKKKKTTRGVLGATMETMKSWTESIGTSIAGRWAEGSLFHLQTKWMRFFFFLFCLSFLCLRSPILARGRQYAGNKD
jgi:hypothetical protein